MQCLVGDGILAEISIGNTRSDFLLIILVPYLLLSLSGMALATGSCEPPRASAQSLTPTSKVDEALVFPAFDPLADGEHL